MTYKPQILSITRIVVTMPYVLYYISIFFWYTVFIQIKRMIWSCARKGTKSLSCPKSVHFATTKGSQEQFQVKETSHKLGISLPLCWCSCYYQEPRFWTRLRTEGHKLYEFLFDPPKYFCLNPLQRMI